MPSKTSKPKFGDVEVSWSNIGMEWIATATNGEETLCFKHPYLSMVLLNLSSELEDRGE